MFPDPPVITEEELESCRENGDYCPILFEWYQFTGLICACIAHTRIDSPALREIPARDYAVLTGLLCRVTRLMHSNVLLSHEGNRGETTSILDRCIFESAAKIMWLCHANDDDRFNRFVADGLKTEIFYRQQIMDLIEERGSILVIEDRMLQSINRYLQTAQMTEEEIINCPKLPNLASMIQCIGGDRLFYTVGQKIGSHHVHGTWPSLILHYLEEQDGRWVPASHQSQTHQNQYVFVPLIVIGALRSFVEFSVQDRESSEAINECLEAVETEIANINREAANGDFNHI